MFDSLTAIRRLYAEPPDRAGSDPAELEPRDQAEVNALRPVKDALEQLPPQRPDPELVNVVVARATHAGIRSLYGEGSQEALPSETAREVAALAPVKRALDELPPQSPDPEVVEEVVARATFAEIRTLYGESTATRLPLEIAREASALAPLKSALDRLPRQRPDTAIVDRIVSAAAVASATRRRQERPAASARPPLRNIRRRIAALVGTAGAVVLFALAALWATQPTPSEQVAGLQAEAETRTVVPETPRGSSSDAEVPPVARQERAEPIPEAPPPSTGQRGTTAGQIATAERSRSVPPPAADRHLPVEQVAASQRPVTRELALAALPPLTHTRFQQPRVFEGRDAAFASMELDDNEEALRLLYLRLEALRNEGLALHDEAVILGATPSPRPTATNGWMQVRIER
jgi:hypothetical protein